LADYMKNAPPRLETGRLLDPHPPNFIRSAFGQYQAKRG